MFKLSESVYSLFFLTISSCHISAHNTSLTLTYFIEVSVQCQESACVFVLVVSMLLLSMVFIWNFRTVPTVWWFLFFILFQIKQ